MQRVEIGEEGGTVLLLMEPRDQLITEEHIRDPDIILSIPSEKMAQHEEELGALTIGDGVRFNATIA